MWSNNTHRTTADLSTRELRLERPLHEAHYPSTSCRPVNVTHRAVEDAFPPPSSSDTHLPLQWTVAVSLLFLVIFTSLLCRHTNSATSDDLCTPPSGEVVSLASRLEGLSLTPATTPRGGDLSWVRRAEQMKLLSSTPAQSCLVPLSAESAHSPQPLLWPAKLPQPRACLMSATASLSLTDKSSWPL